MPTERNIVDLASTISTNTTKYYEFLKDHGLPAPSHEPMPHLPPGPPPALPPDIEAARKAAKEAAFDLHRLLLGPVELVLNAADDSLEVLSLDFILQNNIHTLFPANETSSFKEVANACKLGEDDTRRMMRLAMSHHFFQEKNGAVAHTLATQVLQANPLLAAFGGNVTDEMWRGVPRLVETLKECPDSQEPFDTAYCRAHGFAGDPWLEWPKFPGRIERFANAMKFVQLDPSASPEHLTTTYDFGSLPDGAVLVDVGGSVGFTSTVIAKAFPQIRFVVQDRPEVIASRPPLEPAELENRIEFMAHDFFQAQPVQNADIYYLRWILHDWSDAYSVKILRSLIPALKKGAKIIINDACLPPLGVLPSEQERTMRGFDIMMKTFTNGKERDTEDWHKLIGAVDPGLKLNSIVVPRNSRMAIIEAEWTGTTD